LRDFFYYKATYMLFVVVVVLGYPRLLSGDLSTHHLPTLSTTKQHSLFPETNADKIWTEPNYVRRYYLTFPFYPFRTLCPRDLNTMALSSSSKNTYEFNPTSPLFPANTQLNLVFKKRTSDNFLPFMLPLQLDQTLGSKANSLSATEKGVATTFSVITAGTGENARDVTTKHVITKVEIKVRDVYLQVSNT